MVSLKMVTLLLCATHWGWTDTDKMCDLFGSEPPGLATEGGNRTIDRFNISFRKL
jgi:hypothetical protein